MWGLRLSFVSCLSAGVCVGMSPRFHVKTTKGAQKREKEHRKVNGENFFKLSLDTGQWSYEVEERREESQFG